MFVGSYYNFLVCLTAENVINHLIINIYTVEFVGNPADCLKKTSVAKDFHHAFGALFFCK